MLRMSIGLLGLSNILQMENSVFPEPYRYMLQFIYECLPGTHLPRTLSAPLHILKINLHTRPAV